MGFGAPKFGSDRKSYAQAPKDGDNIERVLPPILSCEESGIWAKPVTTHTCSTPKGDDPKKRNWYTYLCVEKVTWEGGEKVIVQACAECESIKVKKEEYEDLKKRLETEVKGGKTTKEAAREAIRPYVNWLKRHGRDFKFHVNVKTVDGKFITRKYAGGVKKEIDAIIEKYGKLKVPWNPITAEQGLWLNVNKTPSDKTGSGFPEYKVEVVTDEVVHDGNSYQMPKKAPLSEADYEKACQDCLDLNNLGYRKLSPEQVQALVEANEEPEVIDAIFKGSDKRSSAEGSPAAPKREPVRTAPPSNPTPSTPPVAKAGPGPSSAPPKTETVPSRERSPASNIPDDAATLRARAKALLAQAEAAEKPSTPPPPPKTSEQPKPPTPPAASSAPPKADDGLGFDDMLGDSDGFFAQFQTEQDQQG